MKNERIAVCDLARELGVSSRELIQTCHTIGINVIRAAATLTPGQVYRLREAVDSNRDRRRLAIQATARAIRKPETRREDLIKFALCTCCGFRFSYRPLEESHQICSECRHHFEESGEPHERTMKRHEDHVLQSKRKVEDYREACQKLGRERDEAYAKRDKWMAALVEIVVAHGPSEDHDGCVCGAPDYPCLTRRHLRSVNRGIYNRCEELENLNEDEFNKILYGTDYAFFRDWDDGAA